MLQTAQRLANSDSSWTSILWLWGLHRYLAVYLFRGPKAVAPATAGDEFQSLVWLLHTIIFTSLGSGTEKTLPANILSIIPWHSKSTVILRLRESFQWVSSPAWLTSDLTQTTQHTLFQKQSWCMLFKNR